jgi:elongation factor P
MGLIDTTRMRPGVYVEIDGNPHVVISYQHVNPGKGGAFVRLRFKNLASESMLDRTLKAGDVLPEAEISKREMQYLYDDGERMVFMDQESYEQLEIARSAVEGHDLMTENCVVEVLLHNARPLGVTLPNFVILEVIETDPATSGGKLKPAKLSTGAIVQVPSFIGRGEKLRIDTRERKYVERA